ncbi:MAG: putative tail protein [Prokaryotic dsDNA virus sp.]|nr:MAG: putative tail protein [Prokaryotic dsDNA virus sp.]|tara:strand:- start:34963 stop:37170 length:2208 start_codon:yes stop_codon:yes gene_type:complete
MGRSKKKSTVGYRYYLGMQLALCHGPVDEVTRWRADKKVVWQGNVTSNDRVFAWKENLFGGDDREGGILGSSVFNFGDETQTLEPYLEQNLPGDTTLMPAFRGVLQHVIEQCYLGTSPYIKEFDYRVIRIMETGVGQAPRWTSNIAKIFRTDGDGSPDMNPAHIVVELLTNTIWGMGYPLTTLDLAGTFSDTASQLYNEEFGLSFLWDKSKDIEEIIDDVLQHINAALYINPKTGLFELKLLRRDYNPNTIPVINDSNKVKMLKFNRPTVGELTSSVTVKYYDRSTSESDSVTVQDISISRQQGSPVSVTLQMPMVNDRALATEIASRELSALSSPLITGKISIPRSVLQGMNIGDVFKLNYLQYGVANVVCRVVNIDYGTATSRTCVIEFSQDPFAQDLTEYSAPPEPDWQPPSTDPRECPAKLVMTATYRDLIQILGRSDANSLEDDSEFVIAGGARPSGDSFDVAYYVDLGSGYEYEGESDFVPYGTLANPLPLPTTATPVTIQLATSESLDQVAAGTVADIDGELVLINSVDVVNKTVNVHRGALDTYPKDHAAGVNIVFYDENAVLSEQELVVGESANVKMLPSTMSGRLPLADDTAVSHTVEQRHALPYPVGNITLNNDVSLSGNFTGDINIGWARRNRLSLEDQVSHYFMGNMGMEPDTVVNVYIYNADTNSLLKEFLGETGYFVTYTEADETADHGGLATNYRMLVETDRLGVKARVSKTFTVTRTP